MKRYRFVALIVVVVIASALAFSLIACERKVTVTAGERVVCTYGHDVSNDVSSIEVPADKASEYGVRTKTITCPDHLKAEKAYQAAQEDIAKADLKGAAAKLSQVVAIDPAFRRAKAQLAYINTGKKPTPDTSGESAPSTDDGASAKDDEPSAGDDGDDGSSSTEKPTTPGDNGTASGPIASLAGWMPDQLTGFTAEKVYADAFTISREYLPKSGKDVTELVIAAEQFADNSAAKKSLSSNVKVPYSSAGKSVKVNGKAGFLGTNGEVAVLGITDGPVLVIFQMRSEGPKPTSLYDDLVNVAKGLPR